MNIYAKKQNECGKTAEYRWEVHQTIDGYHYDNKPCLASFDNYEEAVDFLYTNNERNYRKLGIMQLKK